jgi:hypothetical protein
MPTLFLLYISKGVSKDSDGKPLAHTVEGVEIIGSDAHKEKPGKLCILRKVLDIPVDKINRYDRE